MTDAERIQLAKNVDIEHLSTTIPGYWKEHLAEKIAKIHEKQIQAGRSGASFGVLADFHGCTNCMHSAALMEEVLTECGIPYFFNAGDFVSGMGIIDPEDLIREIMLARRLFARIADKQLMVLGNHDMAYSTFEAPDYYAEFLTKEEIYEYVYRQQTVYANRVFCEDGTCFYADDVFNKMRYVVMDTHDTPSDELKEDGHAVYNKFRLTGFRDNYVNWFAHVALQVPSADWTVVLCTHEPIDADKGYIYYNKELILGLINAFRKHTAYQGSTCYEDISGYDAQVEVDFTGKGGDFAAWVGGHGHRDEHAVQEGVLTVCTLNDSLHNSSLSEFKHTANTITEQAFDIFTVNKKTHTIYATRIGCGEDREFTYEVY